MGHSAGADRRSEKGHVLGPGRFLADRDAMYPISFKRHRFPPDVFRYAVWLYFRFTLSIRDVEELLA